ncbi:hypothetical protein L1987_09376 [Smallanthus sonchifolius]|uniref:Uncharacterized protein n=1 Tax=Smallanthus sonchifolius TaxID=185202 RepID=A0ACB9JP53_9ASTR|nr:hypothetical protein L1987_09376 [Smallanthus sonchifolius]
MGINLVQAKSRLPFSPGSPFSPDSLSQSNPPTAQSWQHMESCPSLVLATIPEPRQAGESRLGPATEHTSSGWSLNKEQGLNIDTNRRAAARSRHSSPSPFRPSHIPISRNQDPDEVRKSKVRNLTETEEEGMPSPDAYKGSHSSTHFLQTRQILSDIEKMTIKINWLIPLLALMLIIGTIEAGTNHPLRVRKTKSVTPETKSTIERHPMNTNRFDKVSGTDSHHQYNFGTPNHLWGVKATKNIEPEAKSTIENHPIHTEENDSDIEINSHHSYHTACRPGSKCRN